MKTTADTKITRSMPTAKSGKNRVPRNPTDPMPPTSITLERIFARLGIAPSFSHGSMIARMIRKLRNHKFTRREERAKQYDARMRKGAVGTMGKKSPITPRAKLTPPMQRKRTFLRVS